MTEEELHNEHEEYSGKSATELIRELLKLLLVLLWKFLVWLIKKFLKFITVFCTVNRFKRSS